MSRIRALVLASAVISTSYAADVVVEEKPLSKPFPQPTIQTQAIPASKPLQSQPLADNAPSMQWQIYQQVQQLQQEVRDLRGQLEVQANIIDRIKQDAKSRYLDLDQRITDLKNYTPVNSDTVTSPSTVPSTAGTTPSATGGVSATDTSATTTPTTTDSTAKPPAIANPDDEKRAYFAAYQVFKTGGPNKAINPMRNFIKNHPQSTFIPSAYYWLGEFYLAASPADVNNAKKSFKIVAEQFSDAPKAASALLKLGSFADVDGKTPEAIKYMLRIVKNFPTSDEAKAAKSYLAAQNVPLPADKANTKSTAPTVDKTDKAKPTTKTVKSDKNPPHKSPEKAKAN